MQRFEKDVRVLAPLAENGNHMSRYSPSNGLKTCICFLLGSNILNLKVDESKSLNF